MNIHEHQAKQILKQFGAAVPEGVFGFTVEELLEKCKSLKTDKYVLKAQIHAGGRGKAGGVKILNNFSELEKSAKELLGKKLITHQTGPEGREIKRLYVEVSSNIEKEFYLSCLVDRATSKIAFITSDQGGMDIEEVAAKSPDKILTTKVELNYEKTVNITISDDGIGFSKDIIDKLGEPYVSKNNQGMGLGIFIAKNLIENMGGKLDFYNSKDDNAVVEINFDNSILNI